MITSLIEKGELFRDVEGGGGGREIIFNVFYGNHIFRAAEGGEEGERGDGGGEANLDTDLLLCLTASCSKYKNHLQ